MAAPSTISFVKYGRESTFGTKASTIDKTFGHGAKVTGKNARNNLQRIRGLGSRNAEVLQELGFDGQVSMEWVLANPWFWQSVLGSAGISGGGPYTHTFSEADTIPSMTLVNEVSTDTRTAIDMLGAVITSFTMSCPVDDTVRCRAEIPYADEDKDTSDESIVSESFDVFTFADCTLELPNGTTLAHVQNVDFTIENSVELIKGLGSRTAGAAVALARDYTINGTAKFNDSAEALEVLYGSSGGVAASISETADLVLTVTNGESSTSERSHTITVTGIKLDDHNLPQSPTESIQEEWTAFGRSAQVVAVNNTTPTA